MTLIKNDILKIIGHPSTKSSFDNDIYIYIERKTTGSKLTRLGKKKLIKNDVLVLEINNKGILLSKNFYNKDDMNKIGVGRVKDVKEPEDHISSLFDIMSGLITGKFGKFYSLQEQP